MNPQVNPIYKGATRPCALTASLSLSRLNNNNLTMSIITANQPSRKNMLLTALNSPPMFGRTELKK